jgi:hypothetical protein
MTNNHSEFLFKATVVKRDENQVEKTSMATVESRLDMGIDMYMPHV